MRVTRKSLFRVRPFGGDAKDRGKKKPDMVDLKPLRAHLRLVIINGERWKSLWSSGFFSSAQ